LAACCLLRTDIVDESCGVLRHVASKVGDKFMVDLCLSDFLACSRGIEGVGLGGCIKRWGSVVRVCSRFSDVSLLEDSIREMKED